MSTWWNSAGKESQVASGKGDAGRPLPGVVKRHSKWGVNHDPGNQRSLWFIAELATLG